MPDDHFDVPDDHFGVPGKHFGVPDKHFGVPDKHFGEAVERFVVVGALFGVSKWLFLKIFPMKNQKISGCGFHHVAIWTGNWEKSLDFYRDGLGFTTKIEWGQAPSRATMLDVGDGNYLEIFERDPQNQTVGEASVLHLCFRSDDCEKAFETAISAGAKEKLAPKVPEPFTNLGLKTKICFVEGPDGEIIEFFESPDL